MEQIILILLDESLSMKSKRTDIVNGINNFLDVQREINPNTRLILIKFNNIITIMYKGTDIKTIKPIKMCDYNPSGRTALFDAVQCGFSLTNELRTNEEHVNCIILTDGEDNASKQNKSCKSIKKLVNKKEIKYNWSFMYLGRPSESWYRKKPVSDISYRPKRQYMHNSNNSSAVATRLRLRAIHLTS